MVRQYSNKFRPAWAVTVPTQNSEKPASRAVDYKKGEEISGATDGDSTKQKKEEGGRTDAPVASQLSSQESKAHTGRSYSKVFPPSWTIPSKPETPSTKIIDYGNSAGSMNLQRVPRAPQTDVDQSGHNSYRAYRKAPSPPRRIQGYDHFSAESGVGDAAPRPPEGYGAASYSAPMNRSDEAPPRKSQWADYYIDNPPMTATAPWEPWPDYSGAGTTLVGYGHSSDPENMPYSVPTRTSAGNDVPARAPAVSSNYSSII